MSKNSNEFSLSTLTQNTFVRLPQTCNCYMVGPRPRGESCQKNGL